jgi:ABC-type polysaccharide/polyol phosphate export permease
MTVHSGQGLTRERARRMNRPEGLSQPEGDDKGSRNGNVKHQPLTQGALAVRDIFDGALMWPLWGALGWQDIRQRYRRSVIGPFWLTISIGVMIAAMGGLYSGLLRTHVKGYVPHIAIGLVVWNFISTMITEGCSTFTSGQASIKQVKLPLSIYVYRMMWRNLIIFGHNLLVVFVVLVVFAIRPGWSVFLALPAIALLCLNGMSAGMVLGLVSTRFRDIPPMVATAMQVIFFLTPIIWQPESLPARTLVVALNPFFYLLEVVRAPLLGIAPSIVSWGVALTITGAGALTAFAIYVRYRRRIAYWI